MQLYILPSAVNGAGSKKATMLMQAAGGASMAAETVQQASDTSRVHTQLTEEVVPTERAAPEEQSHTADVAAYTTMRDQVKTSNGDDVQIYSYYLQVVCLHDVIMTLYNILALTNLLQLWCSFMLPTCMFSAIRLLVNPNFTTETRWKLWKQRHLPEVTQPACTAWPPDPPNLKCVYNYAGCCQAPSSHAGGCLPGHTGAALCEQPDNPGFRLPNQP